jgi:hypothetical protein
MILTYLVIALLHLQIHGPAPALQPANSDPQQSKVRLQVGDPHAGYRLQHTVTAWDLQ